MSLAGVTFTGEAFSEYYCTSLLPSDPLLRGVLDATGADSIYKATASELRQAGRELRGRVEARSTDTLLLAKLTKLLGWELGERADIATDLGEEEDGGRPLLASAYGKPCARILCTGPHDHLDAPPQGFHRRFAPSHSLPRILQEENLTCGVLLNAHRLRFVYRAGAVPSSIEFDLGLIAEGQEAGQGVWRLLFGLLRGAAWSSEPPLIERVCNEGKQHQERVSSDLGQQVQRAVVRFMQGVLDHPANKEKLPLPVTSEFLSALYQQTLRLLYRLLFTLYAEDLHLLPMGVPTYREGYSLARLTRLARAAGEQSLEQSDPNGAFFESALKALFSLLRIGVNLGPEGEIRPYAGGLFDAKATELIDSMAWGNATVDNVLEFLRFVPAPRREVLIPLSYRELNVEQLGAIYEGLLELTPAFAARRLWRVELDGRVLEIDDGERERIRALRGERSDIEDDDGAEQPEEAEEADASEDSEPKPSRAVKKPMRVLDELRSGEAFLRGGFGRKQSGSYYTNRAFVEFLVREALDPLAQGKSSKEILSLRVLDPAMGSAHFLVGACRRLGEHLRDAYRREVAKARAEYDDELSDADALVLADIPDQLQRIWDAGDEDRELAVCRQLIAGNCIYGVDKNPLAVDLAKVSLWLSTAAAQEPLTFLDHRLCHGDSLLGIPAEEIVRPWTLEDSARSGRRASSIKTTDLLLSPRHEQVKFDFYSPNRQELCHAFGRAFTRLGEMVASIERDSANFALHRAHYAALQGTLEPWRRLHSLRVGTAFQDKPVPPDIINGWLDDLLHLQHVSPEHERVGEPLFADGEAQNAFCWELAFPEVFYKADGERRSDAGFTCILGNPPWDKIKAERDEFYIEYDPLIRQLQGMAKDKRIEQLHQANPEIGEAWDRRERQKKCLADALLATGLYQHQTAEIEEEEELPDGTASIVRKTTGGDADVFKIFIERAWQLLSTGGVFGMVTSKSFHGGDGCTGLRRLVLNNNSLRVLCNFDNERKIFPGIHNAQDFDLVVFSKGGETESFDAAFLTRETEKAVQRFRSHRGYLRLSRADISRLSPQRLTIFEFRGQAEFDLIGRIYQRHPAFGDGLRRQLGLTFRRELDMDKHSYLFRTREWLRTRGCSPEPGEQWRANETTWYENKDYLRRPIAKWYVLFENKRARRHLLPWSVKSSSKISEEDLHDFSIRIPLSGGWRFVGKPIEEGESAVFVHPDDVSEEDLPVHIPGQKTLGAFRIAPCVRPGEEFVPLMEGKWIYHLEHRAMAYVTGSGSWVVTRPMAGDERETIPQYFVQQLDAETRLSKQGEIKIGFRDVSSPGNERTFVCATIPTGLPCGHKVPTFSSESGSKLLAELAAWWSSFAHDYVVRVTGGGTTLGSILARPCPRSSELEDHVIGGLLSTIRDADHSRDERTVAHARALVDCRMAEILELTPFEFAWVISTFPLLDRDQPALPGDHRIRPTNRGIEQVPMSFITRDLALLTYFEYLSARCDIKPDPSRVNRICPNGVPQPPTDLVTFFNAAGVDIGGATEHALASTGPIRDLRERVKQAEALGAVAYVATIDRRRARFVESAAEAGGLPETDGVMTPAMAERVLRDKKLRDERKARAAELWRQMLGYGPGEEQGQSTASMSKPKGRRKAGANRG